MMHKILTFREQPVLNINISRPELENKKITKFYAAAAKAFLEFCERRLYKNAAELYLQAVMADEPGHPPEIFAADMSFELRREQEHTKIYLDININGEKTRVAHIWDNCGGLVKAKKLKKFRSIAT